ncbi:molybdenum cofactor guanylyltransferase MobA [Sulfurimonas sp.]|nr:molybdenum cofactor guanylyltransferase MobA [Sulfurimonas sp.]
MIDIPCIIFAGGKSSRMGEDKALLPFGGFSTITEFQLNKLQKIFNNVYISCKNKNKFTFDAHFIEDIESDGIYAPTIGFVSSFNYLDSQRIFVISVDTPFINSKEIEKIVDADNNSLDATVASLKGKMQPLCGLYHSSLKENFLDMLKTNNHKLGLLLKDVRTLYIDFNDEQKFLNLNDPSQYKKALTLI